MSRIARLALPLVCLVVGAFTAPGSASAQGAKQDARAEVHFHAAETYFAGGNYESAAEEFLAAYELSGKPPLLFNLYLCEERLGHLTKAADYLEQYLSSRAIIADRESLTARVKKIRERAAAEATALAADAAPAPAPEAKADDASANTVLIGPIVAFTVAGVGLVTGGLFGVLTLSTDADVAHDCKTLTQAACDARADDSRGIALVTDIALGVSLAAAVTGLLWLLLDGGDDSDENGGKRAAQGGLSVAPLLVTGGGGLTLRAGF